MFKKILTAKFVAPVLALILAVAMLVGSAYAWADNKQHKTFDLTSGAKQYDVTLIEKKFEGAKDDWNVGKQVPIDLTVKNVSSTDPIYVRVALKEFIEIASYVEKFSDNRYMTNDVGDFYSFSDYDEASKKIKELGLKDDDLDLLDSLYFIKTGWDSPYGQYGKFLCTSRESTIKKLTVNGDGRDYSRRLNDGFNKPTGDVEEYGWPKSFLTSTDTNSEETVRSFVDIAVNKEDTLTLGSTYWLNGGDGYFYWTAPLNHGDATNSLTNYVNLIKKTEDDEFYYGLRADLEAASKSELQNWIVKEKPGKDLVDSWQS
jgi:hypothetical protein